MPITRIEALGLEQVLGSLLVSIVQAQSESTRATVAFVEEIGFESTKEGRRLRTVALRYRKKDENDQPTEFEVEVPLLTLVNVPSLAVKEAKLAFGYDVLTARSDNESSGLLGAFAGKTAITGFVRPSPSGVAPERRATSISLDVTLEQTAAPLGVQQLFDLAELGISERAAVRRDKSK